MNRDIFMGYSFDEDCVCSLCCVGPGLVWAIFTCVKHWYEKEKMAFPWTDAAFIYLFL